MIFRIFLMFFSPLFFSLKKGMEFSRDAGMMMENKRNVCSLEDSSIKRQKANLSFNSKVLLNLVFMDDLSVVSVLVVMILPSLFS